MLRNKRKVKTKIRSVWREVKKKIPPTKKLDQQDNCEKF